MLQRCRWPTAAVERSRQARYPVLDDGDIFDATRMILETMLDEAVHVYGPNKYVTAVHVFFEDALQPHAFRPHGLVALGPEEEWCSKRLHLATKNAHVSWFRKWCAHSNQPKVHDRLWRGPRIRLTHIWQPKHQRLSH